MVNAIFKKETANNRWAIGSDVLKTFVDYFGAGTDQLDLWVENGRVTFTSYTEKIMNGKGSLYDSLGSVAKLIDLDVLKQPLRTSVAIDALDFEDFAVEENLHIGISVQRLQGNHYPCGHP